MNALAMFVYVLDIPKYTYDNDGKIYLQIIYISKNILLTEKIKTNTGGKNCFSNCNSNKIRRTSS